MISSHPFDLLKVRFQTGFYGREEGLVQVVARIAKEEGFRGFYKGAGPVLVGACPLLGLTMFSFEWMKEKLLHSRTPLKDAKISASDELNSAKMKDPLFEKKRREMELSLTDIGLSGSFSGIVTSFILGPAERVKIIIQTSNQVSASNAISSLHKSQGWKGLMRGTFWTMARDCPGNFVYFSVNEAVKRQMKSSQNSRLQNALCVLFSGGKAV